LNSKKKKELVTSVACIAIYTAEAVSVERAELWKRERKGWRVLSSWEWFCATE